MKQNQNSQKSTQIAQPTEASRLQKILAQAGLASRREAEHWIESGRVTVNGQRAVLGQKVVATDQIAVDGKLLERNNTVTEPLVLLYHKPEGEICSRQGQGFPTVFEHLPPLSDGRWISVGRLDLNSSGLLLFTNQGDLANQWMHPKAEWIRCYQIRVDGDVTDSMETKLCRGIMDQGELLKLHSLKRYPAKSTRNQWLEVTLKQGKNREIRRLFSAVGLQVSRLIRIQYGPYYLPEDLAPGNYIFVPIQM
jgi:23S rRNA pseudouridine2605 synthase